MPKRVPWILIVVVALVVAAAFLLRERQGRAPNPTTDDSVVDGPKRGKFIPEKVDFTVPKPKPDLVPIEDGKTIDFSTGLPIVKDSAKDKAALERALKEMEEAAAGVSFGTPEKTTPEQPATEEKRETP